MRDINPQLLEHFGSPYRTIASCWAVKPRVGEWEGYTSLDHDVELPSFADGVSSVPALRYLCAGGVESTTIPSRLNLSKSGVEVSVLAFDRGRLLRGYYRDASFEAFSINYRDISMGRDVVLSGKIGGIDVGPYGANVELIPWAALAETQIGRSCGQLCDVGAYPNEQFGTGRCRNATLNDGPLRAAWSVEATITSVMSAHAFTVSRGSVSVAGSALAVGFDAHLSSGDVEFLDDARGGQNAGASLGIKSANAGVLALHGDLPFVPQVGDVLRLVAGCRRTMSDCQFYNNSANFQGFPQLPGKIGVFNERSE